MTDSSLIQMSAVLLMESGSLIVQLNLCTQTGAALISIDKYLVLRMAGRIPTIVTGSGSRTIVSCQGWEFHPAPPYQIECHPIKLYINFFFLVFDTDLKTYKEGPAMSCILVLEIF